MPQLLVALVVAAAAIAVAAVLRRRQRVAEPTPVSYEVPSRLDRGDFDGVDRPWLVAVFSSSTCDACADMLRKAKVLATSEVTVVEVEYTANVELHRKYGIEAVPIIAVADADGVVRAGFIGPASATDLWAAVAEARDPGSSPEPELGT